MSSAPLTAAPSPSAADLVIGLVADGDPLCETRRLLGAQAAERIVLGLRVAQRSAGARRALLVVAEGWDDAAAALDAARGDFPLERLPRVAACDDPVVLAARFRRYPGERAVTLAAEALAPVARGLQLVQVSGAVARPRILLAEPDALVGDLVAACGGATALAWVGLAGGPVAGAPALADDAIGRARSLVVLPAEHGLVRRARTSLEDLFLRAVSACEGCRLCTDACPRALVGLPLEPHRVVRLLASPAPEGSSDRVRGWLGRAELASTLACSGCGLCDVLCPTQLQPRRIVALPQAALGADGRARPPEAGAPHPEREARGVALERLVAQLGLLDYAVRPESASAAAAITAASPSVVA